jgi:hypothetical protein
MEDYTIKNTFFVCLFYTIICFFLIFSVTETKLLKTFIISFVFFVVSFILCWLSKIFSSNTSQSEDDADAGIGL